MLMTGSYFGVLIVLRDACFMQYVDRLLQRVFLVVCMNFTVRVISCYFIIYYYFVSFYDSVGSYFLVANKLN
jgi:hypothetical protein